MTRSRGYPAAKWVEIVAALVVTAAFFWGCAQIPGRPDSAAARSKPGGPSVSRPGEAPSHLGTSVEVARRVDGDGRQVDIPFVRRGGGGDRPVLFVLGGAFPLEWFGRYVEPVFDVVYLMPVPGSIRLSQRLLDMEAVRESLGLSRISLFGHSEDGAVALEYAAARPNKVERLVWVAGLSDVPRNTRLYFQALSERAKTAAARAHFGQLAGKDSFSPLDLLLSLQARRFAPTCVHPERCRRAAARSRDALNVMGVLSDLRSIGQSREPSLVERLMQAAAPDLRDLPFPDYRSLGAAAGLTDMPILMIQGALDENVFPEISRDLSAVLPGAEYIEYERSGHEPFLDEPERFISDLRRFLGIEAQLPPEPSPLPGDWRPDYDTGELTTEKLDEEAAAIFESRQRRTADMQLAAICQILAELPPPSSVPWLDPDEAAALRSSFCVPPTDSLSQQESTTYLSGGPGVVDLLRITEAYRLTEAVQDSVYLSGQQRVSF